MISSDNQATNALDNRKLPDVSPALDPNAPRVPFPSSLRLDRATEDKLMELATTRIEQLEVELGRTITLWHNWFEREDPEKPTGGRTFMGKRDYYEMTYHNKVEWRRWAVGGIFKESNLTLPVTRRMVRQMIARSVEYFFGTDPWFGVYPVAQQDDELAETIEKHAQWKIENKTNVKNQLIKAIEYAFIRGEAVVKTTFKNRDMIYKTMQNVLVDEQGNEILGTDGLPITEEDSFVQGMNPATGQPFGGMVLERDQITPMPENPIFAPKMITKKNSLYRGPDCGVVYYKDFLCPLTAEDVQSADFICHLYDLPVMSLIDQYSRRDIMNPPTTEEDVRNAQKMMDLLKNMSGDGNVPKTGRNQPRYEWGELQTDNSTENPTSEIAECYLSYDADGDGLVEEIMLVIDKRTMSPIFYDYLGNVSPSGKRPFTVIRINGIDGRWHGVGGMEVFELSQQFIDLCINRRNFAESAAGRTTFWNPSKTLEGQRDPNLVLNTGMTYTLLPGSKKEDALDYVTLPEVKGNNLFEMMETFMQLMQLESGVVNAMDGQAAGLPSAKLATGVRNIEKSGNEMFSLYLEALEPGLTEVLRTAAEIIYQNMDAEEVFTVTNGDAKEVLSLTPDQVRNLDIDVELLLTRSKSEQMLESSVQAANLLNQFYQLQPNVQEKAKLLYVQALKALQIEQAEQIITPVAPQPPQMNPDGTPVDQDTDKSQEPAANIPINDPGQIMPVR